MIIVMRPQVTAEEIEHVEERLHEMGMKAHRSRGEERTIIGVIGDERRIEKEQLEALPGVEDVLRVLKPYKIVSREWQAQDTVIDIGGVPLGGRQLQFIAGPCTVESREQMDASAVAAKNAGCRLMRGGAFKPRTNPYTFQGMGIEGLKIFIQAARAHGLPVVTELMDVRMLDAFVEHDVDVIQIGTRNMQNFALLSEVGRVNKPVILKRGISATITEWLMAAEYIAAAGNHDIIFCERGVRSFETAYRNMLDVTAIPVLKRETHLPVIVDPSHAGGKAWMVPALSRAALAAGADGLLVEVHPEPEKSVSDADQALSPEDLKALMGELTVLAGALGREI